MYIMRTTTEEGNYEVVEYIPPKFNLEPIIRATPPKQYRANILVYDKLKGQFMEEKRNVLITEKPKVTTTYKASEFSSEEARAYEEEARELAMQIPTDEITVLEEICMWFDENTCTPQMSIIYGQLLKQLNNAKDKRDEIYEKIGKMEIYAQAISKVESESVSSDDMASLVIMPFVIMITAIITISGVAMAGDVGILFVIPGAIVALAFAAPFAFPLLGYSAVDSMNTRKKYGIKDKAKDARDIAALAGTVAASAIYLHSMKKGCGNMAKHLKENKTI